MRELDGGRVVGPGVVSVKSGLDNAPISRSDSLAALADITLVFHARGEEGSTGVSAGMVVKRDAELSE